MSVTFDDLLREGARPSLAARAAAMAHAALGWPFRICEARRAMHLLGAMSARDLGDIGLSSQDVRDAAAVPLGSDPTILLQRRACERRAGRRPSI